MPTSATGATEPRNAGPGRARPVRGFTLLELLVVAAIVALVAGMAVLASGGVGDRQLENAARRAEALVELACERAAMTGRDLGFALVEGGLRFGYLVPQGFQPVRDDPADPLRSRPWDASLRFSLLRDGEVLAAEPDPPSTAQVACFASGELTPFTLRLEAEGREGGWELTGSLAGDLELERDHAGAH